MNHGKAHLSTNHTDPSLCKLVSLKRSESLLSTQSVKKGLTFDAECVEGTFESLVRDWATKQSFEISTTEERLVLGMMVSGSIAQLIPRSQLPVSQFPAVNRPPLADALDSPSCFHQAHCSCDGAADGMITGLHEYDHVAGNRVEALDCTLTREAFALRAQNNGALPVFFLQQTFEGREQQGQEEQGQVQG